MTNRITIAGLIGILIFLVALAFAVVRSARAEWPERAFTCKAYLNDIYWRSWAKRHCPGYRWRYHRRYRHAHRAPRPDADVMRYQLLLRERGHDIEPDGLMGPDTRNALRRFQRRHDLDPTGDLGPRTKRALRRSEGRTEGDEEEATERRHCLSEDFHVMSKHSSNESNAKGDAQERWMDAVQASRGGVYMNFELAADKRWRCFQSQSHATLLGKAQEIGSKIVGGDGYHMICEIWARPCAAPIEEGKE